MTVSLKVTVMNPRNLMGHGHMEVWWKTGCRHGPLLCATLLREQQALHHRQVSSSSTRSEVSATSLLRCPTKATTELSNYNKTVPKQVSQPRSKGRDQQPGVQAQPCPGITSSLTHSRSHKTGFRAAPVGPVHPGSAGGAALHGQCPPELLGTLVGMMASLGKAHLPHLGRSTLTCLLFTKHCSTAMKPYGRQPLVFPLVHCSARSEEEYFQYVVLGFIFPLSSCSSR